MGGSRRFRRLALRARILVTTAAAPVRIPIAIPIASAALGQQHLCARMLHFAADLDAHGKKGGVNSLNSLAP